MQRVSSWKMLRDRVIGFDQRARGEAMMFWAIAGKILLQQHHLSHQVFVVRPQLVEIDPARDHIPGFVVAVPDQRVGASLQRHAGNKGPYSLTGSIIHGQRNAGGSLQVDAGDRLGIEWVREVLRQECFGKRQPALPHGSRDGSHDDTHAQIAAIEFVAPSLRGADCDLIDGDESLR